MSDNFAMYEFLHSDTASASGIENFPTWEHADNLERLADTMERVRTILGNSSIMISSGYRCPALNAATGGATNSAHLYGLACDFTAPSFGSPWDICKALEPHLAELDIDQLIWEYETWVHLGLSAGPARHMALTINQYGTHNGFA